MAFLIPLYADSAAATVACTATTQNIEVNARKITLNVDSGVTAVATLNDVPAGIIFTLVAGTIAGGATITVTYNIEPTAGEFVFDDTGETVTLMSLGENDFEVLETTDGVVFVDKTTSES
jgi:hypothetical protein